MQFRSKKDGSHFPVGQKGVSRQTFASVASQDRHRHRTVSKKEKARLTSLENPLLYHNFKEKLEKLNPHKDIESLIDKTMEPEEALMDIKKHHPEIDIGLKSEGQTAEFRQFLDEMGIENAKVQNMVAMDPNPLSEEELANLSYILNNRPPHSQLIDSSLKAPIAKDIRQWMKAPNRTDIPTVDTARRT